MTQEHQRDDVSILFNFTGTVFETSDPLMSLIDVGEPLLYYDRLSVESFSPKPDEREEYINDLIYDMRNMLENRSLSRKDHDGRIRLIVALDLTKGLCDSFEDRTVFFPAQNAKFFKEQVEKVFSEKTIDEDNRLIDRFRYCFVFVDSSNDKQSLPKLYRETGFLGYCPTSIENWISGYMFNGLEKIKSEIVQKHKSVAPDVKLTDDIIKNDYALFHEKLQEVLSYIIQYLKKAGVEERFRTLIDKRLEEVQNMEQFRKIKYKETVLSVINSLVGLSTKSFLDSTFFLLRVKNSPDSEKCKGEIFLKSLIQLLATIDDESFRNNFIPTADMNTPWYFVLDVANAHRPEEDINQKEFGRLISYTERCLDKMQDLRWMKNKRVSYFHYESNVEDPVLSDTHSRINDKLEAERKKKWNAFRQDRKVPFFFGKSPGDWDWYNMVVPKMDAIYEYECENDKPLYDVPKRITDTEMKAIPMECTYTELEVEKGKLASMSAEKMPIENYKQYQIDRLELMKELKKWIGVAKEKMVKLGFLSRLSWISIISYIVLALCFACHYFYNGVQENVIWIAVGFVVAALLFVVGPIIAQRTIKSKIEAAYREVDKTLERLHKLLEDYLDVVHARVKFQDKADIRKRNIDEMQSKLDEFYGHNKQVEIWEKFFAGIVDAINTLITDQPENTEDNIMRLEEKDFPLSQFPFLPYKIRHKFASMETDLMTARMHVDKVTCFVEKFNFSRYPA